MRWQGSLILGAGITGAVAYSLSRAVSNPASRFFGPVFHRGDPRGMQIALTFDDGPDPRWTPAISATLRHYDVPATFFCIGERVEKHPEIVQALAEAGHEIGNHSYSHPNLWFRSRTEVREQLRRSQETLSHAAGVSPVLFRPPFGDRGPQVLREARNLGLTTVLWSLSSEDWNNPESRWIVDRALQSARSGEVVLFHDGSHNNRFPNRQVTLDAICVLVPLLRERGFSFVTVSTMIASMLSRSPYSVGVKLSN